MKKIMAYFMILTTLLLLPAFDENGKAQAVGGYARIETDNAAFYADASLSIVRFILPKSYFVKVIEIGGESTRVSYMGDGGAPYCEGYVKTYDLSFKENDPAAPYPDIKLNVCVDEVMFSDTDLVKPKCVLSKGSTAVFYGEKTISGETYLFVYAHNNIGYVKRSSFDNFEIPMHPEYVVETFLPESGSESTPDTESGATEKSTAEPSAVIIIALLIIGVVCIIFLLFKKEDKRFSSAAFFKDDD